MPISPDGRRLVTAGVDGTARVWDLEDPTRAPTVLRGHEGDIFCVAINPDGRCLVTAGVDGTARVGTWSTQPRPPPSSAAMRRASIPWTTHGRRLVTAGYDATAQVWELDDLDNEPIVLRSSTVTDISGRWACSVILKPEEDTARDGEATPMSLLEHPDAQALLADAVVTPEQVRGCQDRLTTFLQRYLPRFYRAEQRTNATLVIRGLLSGLQRKTCEPIAVEAGVHRKPIQNFVGAGRWDDEAVMAELRGHVREVLADAAGDPGPRPQRLPQVGDRVVRGGPAVVRPAGQAGQLPARRLPRLRRPRRLRAAGPPALPARGLGRRPGPPREVPRPRGGRPSRSRGGSPSTCWSGAARTCPTPGSPATTRWAGPAQFRGWLRRHGERYVLDVPCNTNVRDLECRRPPRRRAGRGRKREVPFCRADAWAARQPESRWTRLTVRDGERGPLRVDAMTVRVRTKEERRVGPEERLVVMRTVEAKPRIDYSLSNAGPEVPLAELVRVRFTRHRIEEVFGAAQGGGRAGAVRGAELGGLAPPHDAVAAGAVVPDPGAAAGRGGKPRR